MDNDIPRVEKPWGYEIHWAKTDRYVGKLIHVAKGHALSLQYHNLKDETIYLHSGRLLFEIDEGGQIQRREMQPGERVHISPKTVHRMKMISSTSITSMRGTTLISDRVVLTRAPRPRRLPDDPF